MFRKAVKIFGGVVVATAALVKIVKLDVEGFPLSSVYPKLWQWRPSSAKSFLTTLIYWNCLKPLNKGNSFLVLDQGWDTNANLLEQLHNLGFDMVINGPSAFDPHAESMGVRFIRVKFQQFKQTHPASPLFVSIVPSYDVCIYTPYLISIDLLRSIAEIGRVSDYILVDLNDPGFPPEYINPQNIIQFYTKAEEKTKLFSKQPRILFKYQNSIISKQSIATEEAKAKLNIPPNNQENIPYPYDQQQFISILNQPNLKVITAAEFFKNPSLKPSLQS